MKLIYATSISYPSSLANRIQTLAMAREFRRVLAREGGDFILGGNDIQGLDQALYGEVENFGTTKSFILGWKYAALAKRVGATHIYCREERLLAFIQFYNAVFFRQPLAYYFEAHDVPKGSTALFVKTLRRSAGVISITRGLKEALVRLGVDSARIHVAPDGIDMSLFASIPDKKAARAKLGLPQEAKIVLYAGHLYAWKGADIFAEAARSLGDVQCVFVGGKESDVQEFRKRYSAADSAAHSASRGIRILGSKPHEDIPAYLAAADLLVLPNSAREDISRLYTSPLKMFEYMAAGRPIVASDLPSIREVLSPENAFFFKPDDAASLAEAIRGVFADQAGAEKRASRARADVQKYTWEMRARDVLSFMNHG